MDDDERRARAGRTALNAQTTSKMAAMTMSSSLVSQRIVAKAASARQARNVQVRAHAHLARSRRFPEA